MRIGFLSKFNNSILSLVQIELYHFKIEMKTSADREILLQKEILCRLISFYLLFVGFMFSIIEYKKEGPPACSCLFRKGEIASERLVKGFVGSG